MYQIAIMETNEGAREHIITHDGAKFLAEKERLEAQGYKVTEYVTTTDRALYCKMRCKVFISELKDFVKDRSEYMSKLYDTEADERVIRATEKSYNDAEEVLINKVGREYARFLRANADEESYEYSDELAVQCYTYRESRMHIANQLAKEIYRKCPHEC